MTQTPTDQDELDRLRFRERALLLRLRQLRGELPMDGRISHQELGEALGLTPEESARLQRVGLLKARLVANKLELRDHLDS